MKVPESVDQGDDSQTRVLSLQRGYRLKAVLYWHVEGGDDQIEGLSMNLLQRLYAVARFPYFVPGAIQHRTKEMADSGVVVDN